MAKKLNTSIIKFKLLFTTPKVAGFIIIIASAVLSFHTGDSTYWSVGVPTGGGMIATETVGDKFGRNGNDKNNSHENS